MSGGANAAPAIALRDLTVSFALADGTTYTAVERASLRVADGEFVSIVGPSGCGKSTLLRIASGLLESTAGTVMIDRRRIGYVFQDPTLMPWRTVRGNVELLPELHGLSAHERRRLARAAIDLVGLTGFEHHYPKSLSGGMRMRCSLADGEAHCFREFFQHIVDPFNQFGTPFN